MLERAVKEKVKKILKEYGCYYFMPSMNGFGKAGVPDFIVCFKGNFLGVECKAGNNKATPLQEKNIADIIAAGGHAMVVNEDTVGNVIEYLKAHGGKRGETEAD